MSSALSAKAVMNNGNLWPRNTSRVDFVGRPQEQSRTLDVYFSVTPR